MTLVLHQFPISHYCEKVRWALDYKELDYRLRNHLPGLHLKPIRRIASATTVPVLEHEQVVVQDSPAIISYLDEHFPEHPLTPAEPELREQAFAWEQFCDTEIGPHVRRFCYDTLLEHPRLVVPMLGHGGPFWGKAFLRLTFPKLRRVMRRIMKIREPEVSGSRRTLEQALARLNHALEERQYLVGEHFTRADLAAASLLAPLFMPPGYGLDWPDTVPEPLNGWVASHREKLAPVEQIYRLHRRGTS